MNKYLCFYKNQKVEIEALTTLQARDFAATKFKAKKAYEVTVVLCEAEGKEITHTATN